MLQYIQLKCVKCNEPVVRNHKIENATCYKCQQKRIREYKAQRNKKYKVY